MKSNKQYVMRFLHNQRISETVLVCDSIFLDSELGVFSKRDCEKIWLPDGIPFLGEFDVYVKVFNKGSFQGFFRLEIFPWYEIHLHIAFPTCNSFKSRYFLKTTAFFLKLLLELVSDFNIYCLVNEQNKNIMKYMAFFGFIPIVQENGLLRFKYGELENLSFGENNS